MARLVKKLTDSEIKNAKASSKPLYDGDGLFLEVSSKGAKLWRFRYAQPYTKKRTTISLGTYPDLSLSQARAKREEYNALLANNIDPQTHRKQQEQAQADKLSHYQGDRGKTPYYARHTPFIQHVIKRERL
ncbi:SlpA [Pasteurella multocida subsp. multocida OH4807]|nr:SlpA [Pasteurella multocida subsp. multocida OH4807]